MSSLLINNIPLEVEVYNNDFALLKTTEGQSLQEIGNAIYKKQFEFIDEVICTEVEICLKFNSNYERGKLSELESLKLSQGAVQQTYFLPIYIQTESKDWNEIEKHSGLTKKEYLEALLKGQYYMSMYGFLPGFLYMRGLDKKLQFTRKSNPDLRIPAGSIAIGGPYLGLYNIASPGGWYVVGQTPLTVFDTDRRPFLEVEVGDGLQLRQISKMEFENLSSNPVTLKEYNANL